MARRRLKASPKPVDLTNILSRHTKGWLALTPDNRSLVATGATIGEVLTKARSKGINNPSLLKATPYSHLFAG